MVAADQLLLIFAAVPVLAFGIGGEFQRYKTLGRRLPQGNRTASEALLSTVHGVASPPGTAIDNPALVSSSGSSNVSSLTALSSPVAPVASGTASARTNAASRLTAPWKGAVVSKYGSNAGASATPANSSALPTHPRPSVQPAHVNGSLATPGLTVSDISVATGVGRNASLSIGSGHGGSQATGGSRPSSHDVGGVFGWNSTLLATTVAPSDAPRTSAIPPPTTGGSSSALPVCSASELRGIVTVFSVVYTTTVTWYGNPADYTPPFPALATPTTCIPLTSTLPSAYSNYSASSEGDNSAYTTSTEMVYGTAVPTTVPGSVSELVPELAHGFGGFRATLLFLTTDKNPAVVYSSVSTPYYGVSDPGSVAIVDHSPATDKGTITTPSYVSDQTRTIVNTKASAARPVTVAIRSSAVVINGHTYTDNPKSKTQTVTVDGQTFVISPTQVIGAGAAVDRPTVTGAIFVATPTSTNIAGVPVVVSSSVAVVGGTSFTIGTTSTTAVVDGQTVSVGPSGVAVAGQTIPVSVRPAATEIVVAGGDLITAVGQSLVVIQGTTITYGAESSSTSTTVVDDDTITIGPSGVIVQNNTLGGPSARASETQYQVVGGASITQIGDSTVVVAGSTFTVSPAAASGSGRLGKAKSTTVLVGGETVTIGADGVSVSTYSIEYPFGQTTTITPAPTSTLKTAVATSSKGAGSSPAPPWTLMSLFLPCIAMGVMGFGD